MENDSRYQILTISLIHLSLKGWENALFELGSERVNECFDYFHCSCAVDETVVFEQSPSARLVCFSLEGFKFIGDNAFVFFHCLERVCNASDPNSRCAKGCEKGQRRKRDTADSKDLYSLAQGPFGDSAKKQRRGVGESQKLEVSKSGKLFLLLPNFFLDIQLLAAGALSSEVKGFNER